MPIITYFKVVFFFAVPPVIQFEKDPQNVLESAAVPGTSGYVPPFKKSVNQSEVENSNSDDYDPDEVVPPSPSRCISGNGTSKGKGKGKQSAPKLGAGSKRKFKDVAANEFPAPISMYDPVSYPHTSFNQFLLN